MVRAIHSANKTNYIITFKASQAQSPVKDAPVIKELSREEKVEEYKKQRNKKLAKAAKIALITASAITLLLGYACYKLGHDPKKLKKPFMTQLKDGWKIFKSKDFSDMLELMFLLFLDF